MKDNRQIAFSSIKVKQGVSKNGREYNLLIASVLIADIEFPVIKAFVSGKALDKLKNANIPFEKVEKK